MFLQNHGQVKAVHSFLYQLHVCLRWIWLKISPLVPQARLKRSTGFVQMWRWYVPRETWTYLLFNCTHYNLESVSTPSLSSSPSYYVMAGVFSKCQVLNQTFSVRQRTTGQVVVTNFLHQHQFFVCKWIKHAAASAHSSSTEWVFSTDHICTGKSETGSTLNSSRRSP